MELWWNHATWGLLFAKMTKKAPEAQILQRSRLC
jgi:hypothetical protein